MTTQYQSLLGTFEPLDILETNSLVVHKDVLVEGTVSTNGFTMPTGASAGLVLTSDASGDGTWTAAANSVAGDASGPFSATVVNTLAGGTIPVNTLVTLTGSQIMTNKTLTNPSISLIQNGF